MPAWPSVPLSAWGRRVWALRRGSGPVDPVDLVDLVDPLDRVDRELGLGPPVPVPRPRTRAGQ